MTLYYVVDPDTEECEGEIEPDTDTSQDILDALENSDYIVSADDTRLVPRPDGEWSVLNQDGETVAWLTLTDPDDDPDLDDSEDDEDFEDDEENEDD